MESTSPLSEACAKALGDKAYEKRRAAALEIEKMASEFNLTKNNVQISKLLNVLREFATSRDSNKRKGGLIGLAAASIGLGKDSEKFIDDLITPILMDLSDQDLRVRYLAAESLYNVVKVSRGAILPSFPKIFASLSRLVTDPDQTVKSASELLDRLLKDIVTESSQNFDLNSFIPLLRERVYAKDSFSRQFIISWISILNAVPGINMIYYLPEILDGLLFMLDDNMQEIHRTCETLLSQFLKNIRSSPQDADIPGMINILIDQAQAKQNELIQYIAISWIREFVQLSGSDILPYTSGICTAVLPCLAYDGDSRRQIKECAQAVNKNLMQLVDMNEPNLSKLDLDKFVEVLRQYIGNGPVNTKVASLKWLHHLFTHAKSRMSRYAVNLFPVLLNILSDSSDEVVLQGLIVLAEIVNSTEFKDDEQFKQTHYREFLISLINLFSDDKIFLEKRGKYIIRHLCILLNGEYVYKTFADIIKDSQNKRFAALMVRTLNTILLTSSELFDLRNSLRDITDAKSAKLFESLYKCWAHCPVSTLSLCLLAQCYQHVSKIVELFANYEVTVEFLTEIDKLVQLIESPIFSSLRLTLVSQNTSEAYHLAKALYGILMLLPQTDAFHLLKNRLQCVPNYWALSQVNTSTTFESKSGIDFDKLMKYFTDIQMQHHEQRLDQRKRTAVEILNR